MRAPAGSGDRRFGCPGRLMARPIRHAPHVAHPAAGREVARRQAIGGARDWNAARHGRNSRSETGSSARSSSANSSGSGFSPASGTEELDSRKLEKQIGQRSSSSASRARSRSAACRVGGACLTLAPSARLNVEKVRSCLWTCANDSASCSISAASARQAPHRRARALVTIIFAPAREPLPL